MMQLATGLNALHELGVIHRDVKSSNAFLSHDGTVKLGDLNLGIICINKLKGKKAGTPLYSSPEMWRKEAYDQKTDIWSLGCIFYELCMLKHPFKAKDDEEMYKNIIRGKFKRIPSMYNDQVWKLI
jgi:NIMA (never in mitosis gene a)-related kinase